jgi:hypothetical protein
MFIHDIHAASGLNKKKEGPRRGLTFHLFCILDQSPTLRRRLLPPPSQPALHNQVQVWITAGSGVQLAAAAVLPVQELPELLPPPPWRG